MQIQELRQTIEAGLLDYPSLSDIYGGLLLRRLTVDDPRSFLFDLLLNASRHVLTSWEETCETYLKVTTNPIEATRKIVQEFGGTWKTSQFDLRLKDSFLELRVVCDLSRRGFTNFTVKTNEDGRAPDFECEVIRGGTTQNACLEVKNIRSPIGITSAFREALREAKLNRPMLSSFDFVIEHYWDNTVSDEQRATIIDFLSRICVQDQAPKTLRLADFTDEQISVTVIAQAGTGNIIQTRLQGAGFPIGPHVRHERLMEKVSKTVKSAIGQLSSCSGRLQILAINFELADGTFSPDMDSEVHNLVTQVSGGKAECIIFHDYEC